jgi:hypothetical protein
VNTLPEGDGPVTNPGPDRQDTHVDSIDQLVTLTDDEIAARWRAARSITPDPAVMAGGHQTLPRGPAASAVGGIGSGRTLKARACSDPSDSGIRDLRSSRVRYMTLL